MGPLGDAVVDSDFSPIEFQPIHGFTSSGCILYVIEIDESKASTPTRMSVQHDLGLLEASKPTKLFLQLSFGGVETETKHTKALVRLRFFPVTLVASSV